MDNNPSVELFLNAKIIINNEIVEYCSILSFTE